MLLIAHFSAKPTSMGVCAADSANSASGIHKLFELLGHVRMNMMKRMLERLLL